MKQSLAILLMLLIAMPVRASYKQARVERSPAARIERDPRVLPGQPPCRTYDVVVPTISTYDAEGHMVDSRRGPVTVAICTYDAGRILFVRAVGGVWASSARSESMVAFNQTTRVAASSSVFTDFAFDSNGNTLTETQSAGAGGGVTTYGWDKDNRLRSVTQPGGSSLYRYDANGLRTERTDSTGTTRYLLDGSSVLQELDAAGPTAITYLNNPQQTDDVLAYQRGNAVEYPLTDALGSLYASTDATGAVVHRYDYEVYGKRTDLGGSAPAVDRGFTGREHDSWGGISHRKRQRNPLLGSWLQPDRLGMADGPNLYDYVRGNPVQLSDPTGESVYVWFWGPNAGETQFGHAALGVSLGPGIRVFGLWPESRVRVGMGFDSPSRGEPGAWLLPSLVESYKSNEGREADAIVELRTERWEEEAILSRAAGGQGATYSLQMNNCATFVASALKPIGFDGRLALESFPISAPAFSRYSSPLTTSTPRRVFKVLTVESYRANLIGWWHEISVIREPQGRLGGLLPFEVEH